MTKKKAAGLGDLTANTNSDTSELPPPCTDITRENWYERTRQWGELGHRFYLVQDDRAHQPPGTHFPPSPRQWGAWIAYFVHAFHHRSFHTRRHMPLAWLDIHGCGTVPAEWPHLFDASWTERQSYAAADSYMAEVERMLRTAPRYLTHPELNLHRDCPRLAAHFKDNPQALAILNAATPAQLRRMVAEHATGKVIRLPEPGDADGVPVPFNPEDPPEHHIQRYRDWKLSLRPHKPRKPFRPYPKLWAAFQREPEVIELLDTSHSFEFTTEASQRLTQLGVDAAREYICSAGAIRRPTKAPKLGDHEPWV